MKNYELLDVVKFPELFCNHSYISEVHHTYISTSFYVELKVIIFFAIEVKPNTEGWIDAILFSLQRQIFLSVGKGKEGGDCVLFCPDCYLAKFLSINGYYSGSEFRVPNIVKRKQE